MVTPRTVTTSKPSWRDGATRIAGISVGLFLFLAQIPGVEDSTVSGVGSEKPAGAASPIKLEHPTSLAVDSKGNLFVAALVQNCVFQVDRQGRVVPVAGTGTAGFSGDGGTGRNASLYSPWGLAVDLAGNLLIADSFNHRVRRVDAASGVITTAIGKGSPTKEGSISGGVQVLIRPTAIAVDRDGSFLIVDSGAYQVYRVEPAKGEARTVVGNGTRGFRGDGGLALSASLDPYGVAVGGNGDIFIADSGNHRIRMVNAQTGLITTVAGTGTPGFGGDGGPATDARLSNPVAIAPSPGGDLLIADSNNHRVRKMDLRTGFITTVAGTGTPGFGGDGGPATGGMLDTPTGIAIDGDGNLFIVDQVNQRIRRVDARTGVITTIAGKGINSSSGDAGPTTRPTSARGKGPER